MTAFTSSVSRRRAPRGFTLIEMAVAMFIITLLLGSLLVPLQTQIESRNYDQTQRILEQAREALIGYAAANGRFPCPASPNTTGAEAFAPVFPGPLGNAGNGRCNPLVNLGADVSSGFLPAATLGFTPVDAQGYALDAWGLQQNRIRYAVSTVTIGVGNTFTFTRTSTGTQGMRFAGMSNIASPALTTLLYVCNSGAGGAAMTAGTNCGTAMALASNAIVVIWSVGPNAALPTGGMSVDELQNPNPNALSLFSPDRIFVSKTKSGGAIEFDDIVTWISPATLFNRLIVAGQLP